MYNPTQVWVRGAITPLKFHLNLTHHVEGSYSTPCSVTSGVPQGSVLGLTHFLMYINDLITDIQSTVRLFGDDCLIYQPMHSSSDHRILLEDLQRLTDWANKWQMKFNALHHATI